MADQQRKEVSLLMGETTIPESFTPEQLRKEAERRELRERAKWVADRRAARNTLVDMLLKLDAQTVRGADATDALRMTFARLRSSDIADQEKEPKNGEIGVAGPIGWWDAVRKDIPHVERHEMLDANRTLPW